MFSRRDVKQARGLWIVLASGIILGLFLLRVVSLDIVRPMVLFDEVEHIDYAVHLSEGVVPTWGTVLNDRTLALASCIQNQDVSAECVRVTPKVEAMSRGFSYQAQQPPLGYLPMAAAARYAVTGTDFHYQQILFLRLANLATFIGLAFALAFTLSFFTRSLVTVAVVAGLLVANPWFFGAFTYVTNDSAAVTVGVLSTGAYMAWLQRTRGPTSRTVLLSAAGGFFLLGVVAGLVKLFSLLPVVAIALAIAMHLFVSRSWLGWRRQFFPFIFSAVGLLSAHAVSVLYRSRSAWVTEREVLSDLLAPSTRSLSEVAVVRLKDFQTLVLGSSVFEGIQAPTYVTPALIALGLISCALILWALASHNSKFIAAVPLTPQGLILSTLLVSLMLLTAVPVVLYFQGPFDSAYIGRYLVPLLPLFALVIIPIIERHRLLQWPLAAATTLAITFLAVPSSELFRNIAF